MDAKYDADNGFATERKEWLPSGDLSKTIMTSNTIITQELGKMFDGSNFSQFLI